MKFEYFSLTDTGQVRANNEDAVAVDASNQIVVLADGMGGYNAGEVAAAMATSLVTTELGRWMAEGGSEAGARDLRRAMARCIESANLSIFNAANDNPPYAGMGTTLVMGVFREACIHIAHVGDSRCYRLRDGALLQLTRDHSLLQEQIDAGLLTLEQAQFATHRNLLTRALGVVETVVPEVSEYRAEEGDLYLLCSDGLTDMLSDAQIGAALASADRLQGKCRALVHAANEAGGRDNISVILVRNQSKPVGRSLLSRMLGQ